MSPPLTRYRAYELFDAKTGDYVGNPLEHTVKLVFKANEVRAVLEDAKRLGKWVESYGLQTQTETLDLTTQEFTEGFRLAQRLLALLDDK